MIKIVSELLNITMYFLTFIFNYLIKNPQQFYFLLKVYPNIKNNSSTKFILQLSKILQGQERFFFPSVALVTWDLHSSQENMVQDFFCLNLFLENIIQVMIYRQRGRNYSHKVFLKNGTSSHMLPKNYQQLIDDEPPLLRLRLPMPCFGLQYGFVSKCRVYSLTGLSNCQI